VPSLVLQGTPADVAIHLDWTINVALPVTATWQIDYYSQTVAPPLSITGIISPTRFYALPGLTNYAWYTVTLSLQGPLPLSDTVRVMPTDIAVYLPLAWRSADSLLR
jgi:hypothetical protein